MQELTFETILRLSQMELKKRLKAELKSRGYLVTDKPGYLYAEGTIPVLLVAHMDTVHRQPVEQICYSEGKAVAMSPQGIGGDDRCGVWMILQILLTANCHVLFCEDEEVGCVGAKRFTKGSLQPRVNYIVELDRRGNNDAVFYRCDNPEFEDFITSFGFETAGGSCSDISYIAPYLETAAVNISCGYYCEHQRHEYIRLEEMELNAARVAQMVTQQTEHFEYREPQDSFFGGRVYQYSMWGMASERETYKWLSPLPKEAKIKLGTAELIMSHIYSESIKSSATGSPMMRAMFLDFADDANTYNLDQQYMFGHSLLVAPVMNEGETEKAVYLPEGEWIDFWHNALTAGGETKTYYADVDSIPVYVKNGSIIPMNLNANYELGGSIGNDVDNYTNLTFRVYPQGNSSYTVNNSDGTSMEIQAMENFDQHKVTVQLPAYDSQITTQIFGSRPSSVTANGNELQQVSSLDEFVAGTDCFFYNANLQCPAPQI